MNNKKRKILYYSLVLFVLLVGSFIIYKVVKADEAYNKIKIKTAKITSIETGDGDFEYDGLNYDNTTIEGYIPGTDSSASNRIVRSFDSVKYNFDFAIADKEGVEDYQERTVNIEVELTEEEAKYVTFDRESMPGERTHTYSFEGMDTYDLPLPLNDDSYNFSFSGLKSAVINLVHNEKQRGREIIKENLAASFQNRVTEILTKKTIKALKDYKVNNLIVAGGVAANKGLRMRLKEECDKENINLTIPEIKYCTDNGAMIGAAGYYAYSKGYKADLSLNAKATAELK